MLEFLRIAVSSMLGTVGFAILIHAPVRSLLPASLMGGLSYIAFWLMTGAGMGDPMAMFISAAMGSVLAQLLARRMRMIATIFILLAIVPLVPGLGLYRYMEMLGSGDTAGAALVGVAAMTSIATLAIGIGVGNFIARLIFDVGRALKR